MSEFHEGDLVTVHDPDYGDFPGHVRAADEHGIYVEGPSLGPTESRHWTWNIGTENLYLVTRRED